MCKNITISIFLIILIVNLNFSKNQDILYIHKYAKFAIEEMHKYKIPASIKLAQALLETNNGESLLAKNANNHFGIKCKKKWNGEIYHHTDDKYMECFRKYSSIRDSYRDHSLFLINGKHYSNLFKFSIMDYKSWAYELKKAGYATNPEYSELLIYKIEKYKLYEFDKIEPQEIDDKLIELLNSKFINNN